MNPTIIERIKKEIQGLDTKSEPQEIGVVTNVGDGVAEIDGLLKAQMMEMVVFATHDGLALADTLAQTSVLYGLVLNLEEESTKVVILGESGLVKEGMTVFRTGKLLSVPVGEAIVGRVVNALGEIIDGKVRLKPKRHAG